MFLRVIGTGSSGNAYVLHDDGKMLLLDAGLSSKRIMEGIGYRVEDVLGCLITHDHQDHCSGARDLARLGVPMYGTAGTRAAVPWLEAAPKPMTQRRLGQFLVMDFPVIHDAVEPCGWLITNTRTGERMLYATDTSGMRYSFPGIHYWLIECNYMDELLRDTPEKQRRRIVQSHMGLETLCAILAANDLRACKQIVLCHISQGHGDYQRMQRRVREATGVPVEIAMAGVTIRLELEPF